MKKVLNFAGPLRAITGIALATQILQGCGPKVLDSHNLRVNNGIVYANDNNEPFTGKVTNVSSETFDYRKHLGGSYFSALQSIPNRETERMMIEVFRNVCDLEVKDGQLHGKSVCKLPKSDRLVFEGVFKKGVADGKFVFYEPSSQNRAVVSAKYSDGKQDGTHEGFHPTTGTRIFHQEWSKGLAEGDQQVWDGNTGTLIALFRYRDGRLNGEQVRYATDGKTVQWKITYVNGQKHGVEEKFSTDGRPVERTEWKMGKHHGRRQVWAESDGRLITDQQWDESEKWPVRDNIQQACVDGWFQAFRKEYGPEAMVKYDQNEEWEKWCNDGKKPPGV